MAAKKPTPIKWDDLNPAARQYWQTKGNTTMEREYSKHGDPVYTADEIEAMLEKAKAHLVTKRDTCNPSYKSFFQDRIESLEYDASRRPASNERLALSCVEWGPPELTHADRQLRDQFYMLPKTRRFP